MDVAIRIQDPSGSVVRDVSVRSEDVHTVADLVDATVDLLGWPRETLAGGVLRYGARRLHAREPLDDGTPLTSLAIVDGDALIVGCVVGA
jgi:hypothetical protein